MPERAESVGFFEDGSPYFSHPLLTAERTANEVGELERLAGSVSGRVLDIGCGFGRHSIELASRGADVTGIDPSAAMISAARERATAAGQFVDFACMAAGDLRDVARYDLVICLFTTFGQLDPDEPDSTTHAGLLRRTKQVLRPGGKLVIEVPDRDRAVDAMVASEQLGSTKVSRQFDTRASVMTERFELDSGATYLLRYQLFDASELADMVHDAGLAVRQLVNRGLAEPPTTMNTLVAERPS